MLLCRIKDCGKKCKVTGDRLCAMHWKRKWLYGNPNIVKRGLNGNGYVRPDGYIRVWRSGEHDLLHRWVMREHLGRKLERYEIVHHKDGNKANNDISNLEVTTLQWHNKYHNTKIKNGTKPCSYCKVVKPLTDFYRDGSRPSPRCIVCIKLTRCKGRK